MLISGFQVTAIGPPTVPPNSCKAGTGLFLFYNASLYSNEGWLAAHSRLSTSDRLEKFGVHVDSICSLCSQELENIDHLFFKCDYAAAVWSGNSVKHHVYRIALVVTLYMIWKERNARIFKSCKLDAHVVFREVQLLCNLNNTDSFAPPKISTYKVSNILFFLKERDFNNEEFNWGLKFITRYNDQRHTVNS
ncbi:uncharacterized protein [Spinacia oleracea]|uniref:Reverse transcriptase zinc-binding domain-containing protein n=1 Tax=Spinacia oleracea TaxID=3562 RepID=A0ABM3QXR1_SPIOL|nr:uncharacterized protein LOC130463132 [Spinacia oleracea]